MLACLSQTLSDSMAVGILDGSTFIFNSHDCFSPSPLSGPTVTPKQSPTTVQGELRSPNKNGLGIVEGPSLVDSHSTAQQLPHSVVDKQHNGNNLHQSQRKYSPSCLVKHSNRNVRVMLGNESVDSCRTHSRMGKCQCGHGSRCMVPQSKQLVPQPDNLQVIRGQMGTISC